MAGNPFKWGGVARGPQFTNREQELRTLESAMRSAQNVVVISPRRFGKTSLVERASERLRREGVLVAYVDLFSAPTKERLADALAQGIYDGLVSPLERAREKARSFFSHLTITPRVTITDDGRTGVEFVAFERAADADVAIRGLLEMPQRIARERKRTVAIVLDEFQEITSIDATLPAVMRSIFQMQDGVSHVFLGSRFHLMQSLFMDKAEPLYRSAMPLPLKPIERPAFTRFIRRRFAASGEAIVDDAVTAILDLTQGRPYETQELCFFAWDQARAEGTSATVAVVRRAIDRVLDAESARYVSIWETVSPHQRALLQALSTGGSGVYAEEYRRVHRLGSTGSVRRSLEALRMRELIDGSAGTWEVSDVFFAEWLRRSVSL